MTINARCGDKLLKLKVRVCEGNFSMALHDWDENSRKGWK